MARNIVFRLDMEPLTRLLRESARETELGARDGLDEVKDEWVADAVDIAPIDKGLLRLSIEGQVEGLELSVTGNARERNFNYGYYIHEQDAGGKNLRHPGTQKKFIDNAVDEAKFESIIEDAIKDRLRRAGW